MNFLDIVILIALLLAAVSGYRKGIIAQACGLAGILPSGWLAFRFSSRLGEWLGFELSRTAAFAILFVVSALVFVLLGKLSGKMLRFTGLGLVDRLGGVLLSVLSYILVLSLLLGFFTSVNDRTGWVKQDVIEKSVLIKPVRRTADLVFPYIKEAKNTVIDKVVPRNENSKPADNSPKKTGKHDSI